MSLCQLFIILYIVGIILNKIDKMSEQELAIQCDQCNSEYSIKEIGITKETAEALAAWSCGICLGTHERTSNPEPKTSPKAKEVKMLPPFVLPRQAGRRTVFPAKMGGLGYKGVCVNGVRGYKAQITITGRSKNLGTYLTPDEAALMYDRHAFVEGKTEFNYPDMLKTYKPSDLPEKIDMNAPRKRKRTNVIITPANQHSSNSSTTFSVLPPPHSSSSTSFSSSSSSSSSTPFTKDKKEKKERKKREKKPKIESKNKTMIAVAKVVEIIYTSAEDYYSRREAPPERETSRQKTKREAEEATILKNIKLNKLRQLKEEQCKKRF